MSIWVVAAITTCAIAWNFWLIVANRAWRRSLVAETAHAARLLNERDDARDRIQVLTAELASRDARLAEMQKQLLDEIKLIGERIAAGEKAA